MRFRCDIPFKLLDCGWKCLSGAIFQPGTATENKYPISGAFSLPIGERANPRRCEPANEHQHSRKNRAHLDEDNSTRRLTLTVFFSVRQPVPSRLVLAKPRGGTQQTLLKLISFPCFSASPSAATCLQRIPRAELHFSKFNSNTSYDPRTHVCRISCKWWISRGTGPGARAGKP